MFLTVTVRNDKGEAVGMIILKDKEFSSGKGGGGGQAKIEVDGERYQAQCQLVKIAAKPEAE